MLKLIKKLFGKKPDYQIVHIGNGMSLMVKDGNTIAIGQVSGNNEMSWKFVMKDNRYV